MIESQFFPDVVLPLKLLIFLYARSQTRQLASASFISAQISGAMGSSKALYNESKAARFDDSKLDFQP